MGNKHATKTSKRSAQIKALKAAYTRTSRAVERLTPLLFPPARRRRVVRDLSKAHKQDLRSTASLPWQTNVLGIAVSEKTTEYKRCAGELCLKFYVRKKLARSRLNSKELIPSVMQLESVGAKVVTDVEQYPYTPILHNGRFRPLRPGSSIGNFRGITRGTLGLIVRKVGDPTPLLLSCSHVLGLGGLGENGDTVEQPGDFDVSTLQNAVGRVLEFTFLDPNFINEVDAGLVELNAGQQTDPAILGMNRPSGIDEVTIADLAQMSGLPLLRSGASTDLQPGTLEGVKASFRLFFEAINATFTYSNLAVYRTDAAGGDSGAAVINGDTNNVIGLHIGGAGPLGFFTPIRTVFDQLNIELYD